MRGNGGKTLVMVQVNTESHGAVCLLVTAVAGNCWQLCQLLSSLASLKV
jgi:hypothetical protein